MSTMLSVLWKCQQKISFQHLKNILKSSYIRTLQSKRGKWREMSKFHNKPANIHHNKQLNNSITTIKQLLHQKYIEKNMQDEIWEEMINSVVTDNLDLQYELCSALVDYDIACAMKYAIKYQIPIDDLCKSLKKSPEVEKSENCDLLELSLPRSAIVYVDHKQKFKEMLEIFQNADIIGCDSEWKAERHARLSIIQIATRHKVFIVDLKAILNVRSYTETEDWLDLYKIFTNRRIKKLGFGFGADVHMMSLNLPEFELLSTEIENFLDLQTLCQKLQVYHPEVFPRRWSGTGRGLADVTKMFLGKTLNKGEKMSNWDVRPLSDKQIIYASLDAFSLLEIYEVFNNRAMDYGVDLDLLMRTSLAKRKKDFTGSKNVISADKFKVLLDSSLYGLGKQLFLSEVDVKTIKISNEDDIITALLVANRENRIIISSRTLRKKSSFQIKPRMWFCVDLLSSSRNQLNKLFRCYNVQDTSSDMFGLCQKCTCSTYLPVPGEVVRLQWKSYLVKSNLVPNVMEELMKAKMFFLCVNCGRIRF